MAAGRPSPGRRGEAPVHLPLAHRNEVTLVGRVTGLAEIRELPSGDLLTAFRVTVDRPVGGHDTVECAALRGRVRRVVASWQRDDVVEVSGALRRRFWQAPGGGRQSRYFVEVEQARRAGAARRPQAAAS